MKIFALIALMIWGLVPNAFSGMFEEAMQLSKDKKYDKASAKFEQLIVLEKNNATAYYNLGNCYYHLKKYPLAIWSYEKALKLNPGDYQAEQNIENCYLQLNNGLGYIPSIKGLKKLIVATPEIIWIVLSVVCAIIIAFCVFQLIRHRNSMWKKLYWLVLILVSLMLITIVYFDARANKVQQGNHEAILLNGDIAYELMEGDNSEAIPLKAGMKVKVISSDSVKTQILVLDKMKLILSTSEIRVI